MSIDYQRRYERLRSLIVPVWTMYEIDDIVMVDAGKDVIRPRWQDKIGD